MMDKHVEELCDSLDAAIFTGDSFFNDEALKRLEWYLGRWSRECRNIRDMLEKEEEGHE